MGDTANSSWDSNGYLGFIRREQSRADVVYTANTIEIQHLPVSTFHNMLSDQGAKFETAVGSIPSGVMVLRLPYPQIEFDRYRKRMLPGEINGQVYRWMHRTDEKVFEDRANSRRHWKLLQHVTREFARKRMRYSVAYTFGDTEAQAKIEYWKGTHGRLS